MDLKCKKLNCIYNKQYACTAKGILVKPNLDCKTFEPLVEVPPEQQEDVSKDIFTQKANIHPYRHHKNVNVTCKAKCLFNNNGQCVANGITVSNTKDDAICITNIYP